MVIQIDREKRNACFKMGNINTAQYLKKLEEETVKNIFKFTGIIGWASNPPAPMLVLGHSEEDSTPEPVLCSVRITARLITDRSV